MDMRAVVVPDSLAALGVARGLGAQGIPVTVLSTDRTTPGQYSRYVRRLACPPKSEETRFVEFLVDLGQRQRERPVLFLTDDAVTVLAHRHRDLLERWYRFTVSPWPVLQAVLMKDRLYRELEGVVPVPRTRVPSGETELREAAAAVGYPAIMKPLLRCLADSGDPGHPPFERTFGAKAVRVRAWPELEAAYRTARAAGFSVILQEEIPGPVSALHSLALYATRNSQVVAAFTSHKLDQVPADFGDGLIVAAIDSPELLPLGEKIVRHFGFYGMADIEFKWDARARVWKLLDINPRPWLWMNLAAACGVNLAYAAYLDAVGRPVPAAAFIQRDFATRWVSARGLLVHLARSARAGRLAEAASACARHLRGRRVGPLFSPEDVLYRMFLSPRFWWDSSREAGHGLLRLRALKESR